MAGLVRFHLGSLLLFSLQIQFIHKTFIIISNTIIIIIIITSNITISVDDLRSVYCFDKYTFYLNPLYPGTALQAEQTIRSKSKGRNREREREREEGRLCEFKEAKGTHTKKASKNIQLAPSSSSSPQKNHPSRYAQLQHIANLLILIRGCVCVGMRFV